MSATTKFLVVLFAVMFFWVYSEAAFASLVNCQKSSGGVVTCWDLTTGKTVIIRTS